MLNKTSKIRLIIIVYTLLPILIVVGILKQNCLIYLFEQTKSFLVQRPEITSHIQSIQKQDSLKQNHFDIEFISEDTLFFNGYRIIRTSEMFDSNYSIFGAAIIKNDSIVFSLDEGGTSPDFSKIGLIQAIAKHNKLIVIQQFSGGAHCCFTATILDLSDSIHVLFKSNDYNDLGYEIGFYDYDSDSNLVLVQSIISFDYFERLCHAISPSSTAFFKYSQSQNKYVNCNREYSGDLLNDINKSIESFKAYSDTINLVKFDDIDGNYLQKVLSIVIDYVYAGERDKGWDFFNQWYRLSDKEKIRASIQRVFDRSSIYKTIYSPVGATK